MSPAEFREKLTSATAEERETLFDTLDDAILPDLTDTLITAATTDPEPTVRNAALRALAKAPPTPAISRTIFKALHDRDWRVQTAAVRLAAKLDPAAAIPPLLGCLADPVIGSEASRVLTRFAPAILVPLALDRYTAGPSIGRPQVISFLAALPGIDEQLHEVFVKPGLQTAAALALGLRGHAEARDRLLSIAVEASPSVADLAIQALTALKSSPGAAAILRLAASDDPDRRSRMAPLLAQVTPDPVAVITATMRERRDWRIREVCATALGTLSDERAFSLLLALTGEEEDFRVRKAAILALGSSPLASGPRQAEIVNGLYAYLDQSGGPLKLSAARALTKMATANATAALIQTLQTGPPQSRLAVINALATERTSQLSTAALWPALSDLTHIDDPHLSAAAANCLLRLPAPPRPTLPPMVTRVWNERFTGLVAPAAAPSSPSIPAPETVPRSRPRYADARFYQDTLLSGRQPLPNSNPLAFNQPYYLEVAIRDKRLGLIFIDGGDHSIDLPAKPVAFTLLVTVQSATFEIEPKVATITVPPEGDSTQNAWFSVKPTVASAGGLNRMSLDVRIYYRFNLLESFSIEAAVATGAVASDIITSVPAIGLVERRFERSLAADLDGYQPRRLNIDVSKVAAGFLLSFACPDSKGGEVALVGASTINPNDIEDLVEDYRTALTKLTVASSYAGNVTGGTLLFRDSIRTLARLGRRAWNLLFPQANQPLNRIGRALLETSVESGSIIQIRLAPSADRFLFPWPLVFDRAFDFESKTLPDLDGFWGYRYIIEQQISTVDPAGVPPDTATPEPAVKLDFMLWNKFPNAAQQVSLMQDYSQRAAGSIHLVGPLIDAVKFREELDKSDSRILYFYTHGHTRTRSASTRGKDVEISTFMSTYEALAPNDPGRTIFADLYQSLKDKRFELDESWIELTNGRVLYDELVDRQMYFPERPLVFLNMCESAQVLPSFSESFVDLFLTAGAGAVLGTECLMTTEFAHPFAEALLDQVFTGVPIGEALLRARLAFRDKLNPLGLAYTLFGSSTLCFKPSRFKGA